MPMSTNGHGPPPCGKKTTGSRSLPPPSRLPLGSAAAADSVAPSPPVSAAVTAAPAKPAAIATRRVTFEEASSVMAHAPAESVTPAREEYAQLPRAALGLRSVQTVASAQRLSLRLAHAQNPLQDAATRRANETAS